MLYLHQSNRLENLYQALSQQLGSAIDDALMAEIIVVEEPGMGRWLAQRIARDRGIAANLRFPLPAGFVWQLLASQLELDETQGSLGKASLLWYAMQLLPRLRRHRAFAPINRYLDGPDPETRLYQLSREVADVFDQYLVYRPEMILQWEAGAGDDWQPELWRAIRDIARQPHWAGLVEAFVKRIDSDGWRGHGLPRRVSLFAINSLSPGYIELLGHVGRHIDIHLFIVNPSYHYWGDIVSPRDLARLRECWRRNGRADVSTLYDIGHPLLASLGRPSRDFINQWQDHSPFEQEYFEEPDSGSLLARVQADILNLQMPGIESLPAREIAADGSLEVHACHSPVRELQVLHDLLLGLFDGERNAALDGLGPADIVVMAPDINAYAEAIEAVFGAAPAPRQIPYSIAGRLPAGQPVIETLLDWLLLPEHRFDAPAVISWLDLDAVRAKLRLGDDALERIRGWVAGSGIRWGLDGRHKAELGLPENEHNTWRFGFRRLYLGYAMSDQAGLFAGAAPFSDIDGGDVEWLGQLEAFVELLAAFRQEFSSPATLPVWQARINRLIGQFLQPDEFEMAVIDDLRQQLSMLVDNVSATGFDDTLGYRVIHQHLVQLLSKPAGSYGLLAGGVTFCNMVALRAVPFRVVCLLGMSDDQFPRRQQPPGFDLISAAPRSGDRSLRQDDRNLFLQALLSARDIMHISYVGHSQQDNSERLPSVVVSELLDVIEQGYRVEGADLRASIHFHHPLQPFSRCNFERGSYAAEWQQQPIEVRPFASRPIDRQAPTREDQPDLSALTRFMLNPARHFLERGLGIQVAEYDETLEDSERFDLDSLQRYRMMTELLNDCLQDADMQQGLMSMMARGELPHGETGRASYQQMLDTVEPLVTHLKPFFGDGFESHDIQLEADGFSLRGRLQRIPGNGLLSFRPARVGARDRLRLWVEHLALCASGESPQSHHFGTDEGIVMNPVEVDVALRLLERMSGLYAEGLCRPIPLLLRSSVAYAMSLDEDGGNAEEALRKARAKWPSNEFASGDDADPWIALAFRDTDPYTPEFEQLAADLLMPMQQHTDRYR